MNQFLRNIRRLCVLSLLIATLSSVQGQEGVPTGSDKTIQIKNCACELTLPPGYSVTAQNDRMVVARKTVRMNGRAIPLMLRFLCAPNPRRTSMISDIRDKAREKNINIRRFSTTEVAENLTAAYYMKSRIHKGRVIQNAEGYFATVSNEYYLQIIPEISTQKAPAKMHLLLLDETRQTLEGLHFFAFFTPAITEANFRIRLYLSIGLLVFIVAGLLGLLWHRSARKKRIRQMESEDGVPTEDESPT